MTTRLHPHQHDRYRRMPRYFWLFAALQLLAALLLDSPGNILRGLRTIVYTEDALITDYIAVAGPGGRPVQRRPGHRHHPVPALFLQRDL